MDRQATPDILFSFYSKMKAMPSAPLASDAAARRAIVEDLQHTLVVEAAAGTGKTTELINRIVRILESAPPAGATMKEIVAVTFTEKAAGELKLRLRERLEEERARLRSQNGAASFGGASPGVEVASMGQAGDVAERAARLDNALETLEEAHVNTIHGFCAELLRERPVEARVDPLFTVLTEPQADRLYNRAFGTWLQAALQNPSDGLRRALRRSSSPAFSGAGDGDGPVDRLRRAGRLLAEWRAFDAEWRRPAFDRDVEIQRVVDGLHRLADLTATASSKNDNLFVDTDAVRRLSQQIRLEQSFEVHDFDGWEARLVDLVRDRGLSRTRKGSGHKYGAGITRVEVLSARDEFFAALQQFKRDADADLAARLQQELRAATVRYQDLKVAAGALDFADLLARARDLIRGDESVRRHLQSKFARIFVDEFQDTDPIQAEIVLLLAADDPTETDWTAATTIPGKLFIVGDPKQAIYRFRGTDVGTYWQVSRQIESRGGKVVQLTKSYRGVPEIQRLINTAFGAEMTADSHTLQAGYVPLDEHRPSEPTQPSIVVLPVPRPYSDTSHTFLRASAKAIETSLPDAVGAFIAWLVSGKHGWTVGERTANGHEERVPVQSRHIAILFRRFVSFGDDVTAAYTDAIEARGIPHLLVGGKAFHGREEVETVRAALAAIEWPDDELSVFATLKGSLFAIDDERLLEFRYRFGHFHAFRIPKELGGNLGQDLVLTAEPTAHLMPIAEALRLLQQLHRARNYRPVADTIGRLLSETRAHVGFILRPGGEQALANVLHVAELARQYEANGGISFRGFIDELREAAESEGAEAPILEESSDGVRLMTVHKAKGLEFPVVILADMTCKMNRADASRYLDASRRLCAMKIGGWTPLDVLDHEAEEVARDQAEGVRLAYVAATRARDLLVVPALGDAPWEGGWCGPLNRAIYPPVASRRQSAQGPGCPAFRSKDSVLERPNEDPAGPQTVCPGLHAFPERYSVVWWDPRPGGGLELGLKAPFGVRREELIVKDVAKDVVADGRTNYDRWVLARADAVAAGSEPSVYFDTVHQWSAVAEHELPASADATAVDVVTVAAVPETAARRGGAAFGILVHSVLAQIPFDATRPLLEDVAQMEARVLGLTEEDASAAAATVEGVLRNDLLVRAGRASTRGACRRETPVTLTLPDGTLVEGVVDLAFEDRGTWFVVDYKTDRELELGETAYRRQVAIYAAAIAAATGQAAKGILVRV
jgi:ATP-dependent exoDNAse (exonuclease V) beta subunit